MVEKRGNEGGRSSRKRVQTIRTDIFIGKLMGESYSLWLMLDRLSVDNRRLELFENAPMNRVTLRGTDSVSSLPRGCT
jgi:hypothetical protein